MTCKAANFGVFSHKRLKADTGLVDGAFEVKRGRHDHLLLMCGGTGAKPKSSAHRPGRVPGVACSSFSQGHESTSLKQVLVDSGLRYGQARKSVGRPPARGVHVATHDLPVTLCVTSVTPLTLTVTHSGPARGYTQGKAGNSRKRPSADGSDILETSKRRKQECDSARHNPQDDITCPALGQLQPVVCDSDQAIPLNDDARDADIEVDSADVFFGRPSSEDCSTAPYDVSSKSGVFPAALTVIPSISSASPPLGTPFEVDSDSSESQLEKQRRYAEGLERGIQEFLNQKLPLSFSSSHEHQAQDAIIAPSQGRGHRGRVTKGRKHNSRSGNELVPRGSDWPAVQLTDESQLMLEAAQGFVLMLDGQHRILYVSENVRQHLGHEQINLLGQNIQDYLHPKDVSDFLSNVRDVAIDSGNCWNQTRKRMFCVGMRFCFQKAGSRHKDTGYTFVQWNAKLQLKTGQHAQVQHLVALCRPVRTDSILELRMDGNMFISRHDLSFHFIYCDPRIINLIGYEPSDLIGRTAYQFHCPRDVLICKQCHKLLILSGSSKSDYYRFLSRSGKWVWLCTHATIVYDTTKKPQYVVCKNFVISEQEARKKLAEEFKDFADMKCLGFSLETDLPVIDSVTTSGNSLSYHIDQDEDGEALVNHLLSMLPVDVSDNPYARPRKKRNSNRLSANMGVPIPSSNAKYSSSNSNRLKTDMLLSQDTNVSSELCSTNPASSMETVSSFDQLFITQPQADDVFALPASDDFSISFSDMLETAMMEGPIRTTEESETISPASDLSDHGQSMSEVCQNTTLPDISISSDLELNSSFPGYKQVETDFLDLMDCTPSVSQSPIAVDTGLPSIYIKTTTNTISRYPAGNISVLPNILPAKTTIVQLTHPLNKSEKLHTSVSSQNHHSSSRLFSLLKNNNPGDSLTPSPKVKTGTSPPAKANVNILKDVFLSQDKFPGTQHFIVMKSAGPALSVPVNSIRSSASTVTGIFSGPSRKMTESACPDQTNGDVMFSVSEDVSSVLTNGNSDPFLCQLTESTLYTDPYMMEEDLCPNLSGMIPHTPATDDPVLEKQDSCSSSSSSTTTNSFSPAGMKDLDTFFSIISTSSESIMSLGDNPDSQTIPFTEQLDFSCDQDQSLAKNSPVSLTSNESSSDSDTPGRPSLLRTLLDKEGEAIQGPLTYKEWVLEEALRKKSELKKAKISYGSPKHASNLRLRNNKPGKSTELPLPKSHFGNRFSYSREVALQRKPTKELPLPLSAQRQKSFDSSHTSGNLNQFDSEVNLSSSDMNLPDDLLDLAVEYCATLGPDQAEALLKDLNDSPSFEDNLYSLIASPSQSRTSGSKQISVLGSALSCPVSGNNHLLNSKIYPISPSSSSYLASPSSPSADKSENLIGSPLGNVSSILNKTPAISSTESGKMSLLRAAVTSPDVDKLIEQIPFGNRISFYQSPPETVSEDPDIVITKVNGLQKMSVEDNLPESSVFKVPSLNSAKSSGKTSPSKPFQNSNSPLNSSDHIDAILFDHLYTASLAMSSSSPPRSPTITINAQSRAPGSVLSPRVHSETSGHKTIRGSQSKHKSNPTSPRPSQVGYGCPNSPRAAGITNSDLSSTHPISVMIMKKDSHRSRRSRSIGLQTDNEPDEVYPDFERSSTDTILYPSGSRLSSSSSPTRSDTSGTASLSSSPTMSELEKFLRGFSSQDENSPSTDEDNKSKRGTPFLQKLLTGELTKDNYQRIDQQLLDRERRESISSGSDYELT